MKDNFFFDDVWCMCVSRINVDSFRIYKNDSMCVISCVEINVFHSDVWKEVIFVTSSMIWYEYGVYCIVLLIEQNNWKFFVKI